MSAKGIHPKIQHRRRPSCLPSCFVASPVSNLNEAESPTIGTCSSRRISLFSWSSFRKKKKKKTVPLESSSEITSSHRSNKDKSYAPALEASARKSFSEKLRKARNRISQSDPQQNENHHHQRPAAEKIDMRTQGSQPPRLRQIFPEVDAELHVVQPTRTIHPSWPVLHLKPLKRSNEAARKLGPGTGLSVLVFTLGVMLVWGRACAVVCLCVFFYCLPLLRVTEAGTEEKTAAVANEVDIDSDVYKKRVVLEGLLERNGRRPLVVSALSR